MKKKTCSRRVSVAHRLPVLLDYACPGCGTGMIEKRGALRLRIDGEEISYPASLHLSCPKCGEIFFRFQDAKRLHEDAIAIYRKKHGLLSADQIREIRARFNLTQADLRACSG